jgi:hypothetical protein
LSSEDIAIKIMTDPSLRNNMIDVAKELIKSLRELP